MTGPLDALRPAGCTCTVTSSTTLRLDRGCPVHGSVKVRIENAYSDGHESSSEVTVPPPADDVDAWFDEVVYQHTGDGHGLDRTLGSCYTATVVAAADPALVGLEREWVD